MSNKYSPLCCSVYFPVPHLDIFETLLLTYGMKEEKVSFTLPSRDIFIAPLCSCRLVMFFSRPISGIMLWNFKAAMKSSISDPKIKSRTEIRIIRFLIQSLINKLPLAKQMYVKKTHLESEPTYIFYIFFLYELNFLKTVNISAVIWFFFNTWFIIFFKYQLLRYHQ